MDETQNPIIDAISGAGGQQVSEDSLYFEIGTDVSGNQSSDTLLGGTGGDKLDQNCEEFLDKNNESSQQLIDVLTQAAKGIGLTGLTQALGLGVKGVEMTNNALQAGIAPTNDAVAQVLYDYCVTNQ